MGISREGDVWFGDEIVGEEEEEEEGEEEEEEKEEEEEEEEKEEEEERGEDVFSVKRSYCGT
jgi:hypothetical protein